ncbi:MAG: ATP/GTP-binding protein [Candidatus Odinarchaeia archaeon]
MIFIYFVGTAGSGKSTLVSVFSEYLDSLEVDNIRVNLDPAVVNVPYTCDVDVREYIDLEAVMSGYNLGPNGAIIACTDMIAGKIDKIAREIELLNPEVVLLDTPGQIELFAFRSAGPYIVNSLGEDKKVSLFLMDPIISKNAPGYVSALLLSASTQIRLSTPQINLLSKMDLLNKNELEKILLWAENPLELLESLNKEDKGLSRTISTKICKTLIEMDSIPPIIPVSAKNNVGIQELYAEISRILLGGEDSLLFSS